jgi:hypothetical protein
VQERTLRRYFCAHVICELALDRPMYARVGPLHKRCNNKVPLAVLDPLCVCGLLPAGWGLDAQMSTCTHLDSRAR